MSRAFIGFGQVNYIGAPYQRPIQICNGGKAVPLYFDWNAYGASSANPNINVKVSLQTADVKVTLLSQIASVYIDNTNSPIPIYVYCPDTKYTAIAQANSAGWYPLYTNAFEIWVIGQGFTTGQIPQTQIFVSDLFIPPFTDQELVQSVMLGKASAVIQRGNTIFNSNYAAFALGDQSWQGLCHMQNNGEIINLFPVQSSGFYIITGCVVSVIASQPLSGGTNGTALVWFESAGLSGAFRQQQYFLPKSDNTSLTQVTTPNYGNTMIFQSGFVQWKIAANEQWRLRVDATSIGTIQGNMFWDFTYTFNPN